MKPNKNRGSRTEFTLQGKIALGIFVAVCVQFFVVLDEPVTDERLTDWLLYFGSAPILFSGWFLGIYFGKISGFDNNQKGWERVKMRGACFFLAVMTITFFVNNSIIQLNRWFSSDTGYETARVISSTEIEHPGRRGRGGWISYEVVVVVDNERYTLRTNNDHSSGEILRPLRKGAFGLWFKPDIPNSELSGMRHFKPYRLKKSAFGK